MSLVDTFSSSSSSSSSASLSPFSSPPASSTTRTRSMSILHPLAYSYDSMNKHSRPAKDSRIQRPKNVLGGVQRIRLNARCYVFPQ